MARQDSSAQREEAYEGSGIRRNPYLVDYEVQRRRHTSPGGSPVSQRRQMPSGRRGASGRSMPGGCAVRQTESEGGSASRLESYRNPVREEYEPEYSDTADEFYEGQENGRAAWGQGGIYRDAPESEYSRNCRRKAAVNEAGTYPDATAAGGYTRNRREEPGRGSARNRRKELDSSWIGNGREEPETRRTRSRQNLQGAGRGQMRRRESQAGRAPSRRSPAASVRPITYDLAPKARPAAGRASASQRRAAVQRRKKQALMQRLFVGAWILCILLFAVVFAVKSSRAAEDQKENSLPVSGELEENSTPRASGLTVQGVSAEKFAEHPEWTEDFLTPNEYSRPGNALESVNNIFVHYTANPGTSAAQNRSYFEWQKDTHEASVSAHFVIGYEGEIIQCVPLDEIAYAVMTRNYDSLSIECCYLERDGSFTQATYNSLIALLSWLTDVYDLDSEDILRHYDCGGKKCPLYYTEHPGAWEQLKKDVDNFSNL